MPNGLKHQDWGGRSATSWPLAPSSREPMQAPSAELLSTVHEELVPRLVLAHSLEQPGPADERTPPTQEEVAELARIALGGDGREALRFVMSVEGQGISRGSVLLLLVAPAARMVRDLWLSEQSTFTEVTAALGVLHGIVNELRSCAVPTPSDPDERV